MKQTALLFALSGALLFTACNGTNGGAAATNAKQFPVAGTTVAAATMPYTDDPLNNFNFSLQVIADSDIIDGVYDANAVCGYDTAKGKFTMPKGGEDLKPLVRKGSDPYTYVIGFKVANDTTFYDYFEVSFAHNTMKMQYLKAYTF